MSKKRQDMNRHNRENSFTLVELILVITIMGILVGAITPNLRFALEGRNLNTAAQGLAGTIRYARSVAVQRAVVTKLVFDFETGDVTFFVESDPFNNAGNFMPEPLPTAYNKGIKKQVRIARIDKRALSGSQMENEITFLSNGSTSDTFIYLVDQSENVNTVGIVGLIGQVIVWGEAVDNFYV
jgi:Tfp pilus assembly protein FimT